MNTGVLVVLGEQNVNDVKPAGCVQPLPGCKCLVMPGWHGPLPQPSRAWRDVSLVSRKKNDSASRFRVPDFPLLVAAPLPSFFFYTEYLSL